MRARVCGPEPMAMTLGNESNVVGGGRPLLYVLSKAYRPSLDSILDDQDCKRMPLRRALGMSCFASIDREGVHTHERESKCFVCKKVNLLRRAITPAIRKTEPENSANRRVY